MSRVPAVREEGGSEVVAKETSADRCGSRIRSRGAAPGSDIIVASKRQTDLWRAARLAAGPIDTAIAPVQSGLGIVRRVFGATMLEPPRAGFGHRAAALVAAGRALQRPSAAGAVGCDDALCHHRIGFGQCWALAG